jgi:hypothetical protein
MIAAEPCSAMLDTMPEDFVRLNTGELDFLLGALQYLPQNHQNYLEEYTKVDSSALYAKLFDSWKALETND